MNVVPLMPDTLVETQQLAAKLFPGEHKHQFAPTATVAPNAHTSFFRDHVRSRVEFWTPILQNRVVGLAGLYHYAAQPDELWLAWYGLHATARGQGRGTRFLEWIIARAAAEHKRTLRLWTTDEAEYAKALELYESHGFRSEPWAALPGETWHTYVLSLGLDGHQPLPWARLHPSGELCGREAPHLVAA